MINVVMLMPSEVSYMMSNEAFAKIGNALRFSVANALIAEEREIAVYDLPARWALTTVDVQILCIVPGHTKWLVRVSELRTALMMTILALRDDPDCQKFLIELNEVTTTSILPPGVEQQVELFET